MFDPFTIPDNENIYFNERATGLRVLHGSTALGTYEFWYVKNPATVSIGQERNKVITGGTLTNAIVYYVYEEAVYSGTTYAMGETITGSGATLTSGIVISTANIVTCDLPSILQDEVCRMSSKIMCQTIEDFNKEQFIQQDLNKY